MVNRSQQKGFTIVELCAAFAVVTVLAVALVHIGHGKAQSMTRAFRETLALRLCQAELERTRLDPARLVLGEQAFDLPEEAARLPGGHGSRVVTEVASSLFEITVQVAWLPAGARDEASVRLVTRKAREEGGR